ncbi:MAG: ATP-binding protein, partial [Cyanobacteria bacterium J06641_5]
RPCVPILVAPAIANLVRNGFEALEGADKPQLSVATRLCDRSVEIEVSDNGPGVPAAARAQIFQKLVSSKGDRHRGLGLYLSKQLIEKAGGQIRVTDSAVGGARFLIQLSLPKA